MSRPVSRKRPFSAKEKAQHAWFRCHTKRRYDTWDGAERAARILMDDIRAGTVRDKKSGVLVAYLCRFSPEVGQEHYHIGHSKPPLGTKGRSHK